MSKKIDITGQRYEKWFVVKYFKNGKYLCRCDCGKEKYISGQKLRKGLTKQCSKCAKRVLQDLSGNEIGNWVILKYLGHGRYLCKCKKCEKEYIRGGSNIKYGGSLKCRKCENTERNIRNSGERHWNYKDGNGKNTSGLWLSFDYIKWRKEIMSRDDYICQLCGDNKGHNLQAHHILPKGIYPLLTYDISNGITLCDSCHKLVHKRKSYKKFLKILINKVPA